MESVGNALRSIRISHDCSLEQLSQRTRISERVLSEMEQGDFRSIRGQFYRHHFIREYLRALGEDPQLFFKSHNIPPVPLAEQNGPSVGAVEKIRVYRFRRRRGLAWFLAALLLVVAAVVLFAKHGTRVLEWFQPAQAPHLQSVGAAFEPGWPRLLAGHRADESLCAWLDRETRIWGAAASPASARVRFLDRCWARVLRSGQTQVARMFHPGEELLAAGYDLQLSLGDPSRVNLMLNGKVEALDQSQRKPVTFSVRRAPPFPVESHESDPLP